MDTTIEKKQSKEIQRGNTPADMIRLAVEGGADLEKLSKLLDIQERWEANEAKKAYHQAMSCFKANPPQIYKDKSVSFGAGKTSYKHATLANVCEKINKALSQYGLSASWETAQSESLISVTCRITHEKGHSESTTLKAPADASGSKNAIQAIGSTVSYLERYTILALTGLATEEQDDDANIQTEKIDEKEAVVINEYLGSLKIDKVKFLSFFSIEKVEDMPKSRYQEAITMFKSKEVKK